MKRLFILVLCFLMLNPLTVLAAESTPNTLSALAAEKVDYLNYDFPDDAVILYQGEDGVIYQSNEKTVEEAGGASARAMYYNGVWINAGIWASSSFSVKNPHTLLLKTYGTLKLESDNPDARVNIIVSGNAVPICNKTIKPGDGEVYFESTNNAQEYIIHYSVWDTSDKAGMRVNCWLY